VVWQGFNPDTGGTDIYAQRYDPAGHPAGGEVLVNAFTAGAQTDPRVALDAAGDFVVAWTGVGADDSDGVYLRAFTADGSALGTDVWVNTAGATGFQGAPDVALAADGRLVVAWAGFVPPQLAGYDIGAQRFRLADGAVTPVG